MCRNNVDCQGEHSTPALPLALLIEKAKSGDRYSLEMLLVSEQAFITRQIAKLVPRDSLDDVAQEVVMRVIKALPQYQEKGSFKWWLRKIISRACLDFWRKERKQVRLTKDYLADHNLSKISFSDKVLLEELESFLSELSSEDRLVFTMAYLEDLSHADISELLGISLAATKVRCFRLRKKIRAKFKYEK